MKFRSRPLIVIGSIAASAAFVLALFLYQRDDPPLGVLSNARCALDRAAVAGAIRYCSATYCAAESTLNAGQMAMAYQNGRPALLRDYEEADTLIARGLALAVQAGEQTQGRIRSLDSLARFEYDHLEEELELCREALDGTLTNFSAERHWAGAELSLRTGWLLINKGEYEESMRSMEKGKASLRQAVEAMAEVVNNEKGKISVWRNWVEDTVAGSRDNGCAAVIVDKSAHKAYLVNGGKIVQTYRCDLGWNSAEQKYFQGDGATPEGTYVITAVKNRSKYYKALLINYPNDLDKRRFAENKRKGVISRYAKIGALIEIHGSGGRGQDWTDGCIALADRDMDGLMRRVSVGTPVTIVRRSDRWP
ncbi:MAG: L,D-transpeptidase [bacterium]